MVDRTKIYEADVSLKTNYGEITIPVPEGSLEIADQSTVPVGIYFSHSDEKRFVDITKEEWRGQSGSIISDNLIEAVFKLVEDSNLDQEKAVSILKEHGFSWGRKEENTSE